MWVIWLRLQRFGTWWWMMGSNWISMSLRRWWRPSSRRIGTPRTQHYLERHRHSPRSRPGPNLFMFLERPYPANLVDPPVSPAPLSLQNIWTRLVSPAKPIRPRSFAQPYIVLKMLKVILLKPFYSFLSLVSLSGFLLRTISDVVLEILQNQI